jgi:hypothetical protein
VSGDASSGSVKISSGMFDMIFPNVLYSLERY